MGVIYKLLPKVKNFILKKKKDNPQLGCRNLSDLVKKKFGMSLGKSHIAQFLKREGMSSPVGRRKKRPYIRKRILLCQGLGNFFLKCADLSLKGVSSLVEPIKKRFPYLSPFTIQAKNEVLLYLSLSGIKDLEEIKKIGGLPELILLLTGKNYRYSGLISYHQKLKRFRASYELFSRFASSLEEGLYLKFLLEDGSKFYLDCQMHSVWSEHRIPSEFSLGINRIKEYLDSFIQGKEPLILQNCPGFEIPTKEFFYFIKTLEAEEKICKIKNIFVHSQDLRILDFENIEFKKRYFIIGLWPWQYQKKRKIKELSEFKEFTKFPLKEDLKISEAEIELAELKLRAIILRDNKGVKIILLTNILDMTTEEVTLRYLERWPNLEEGFQDFSKKLELSTYEERKKIKSLEMEFSSGLQLGENFDFWLKNLNSYCQRHFFPLNYRELDSSEIKERFYNLSGKIEKDSGYIFVRFLPPQNYPYLKDLIYSCNRVNESDITTPKGERIYFEVLSSP